jgi:hypothetical protein
MQSRGAVIVVAPQFAAVAMLVLAIAWLTAGTGTAGDLLPETGDARGWTVHFMGILTPDGGDLGLSWENPSQMIPGAQPGAFSPGFFRGIFFENDGQNALDAQDRLVVHIANWIVDGNGFPVYHVIFGVVPAVHDPLAPWRLDYAGLTDAQTTTLVTGLLSPVDTFVSSYLSMLQLAVRVGEMTYNIRFL